MFKKKLGHDIKNWLISLFSLSNFCLRCQSLLSPWIFSLHCRRKKVIFGYLLLMIIQLCDSVIITFFCAKTLLDIFSICMVKKVCTREQKAYKIWTLNYLGAFYTLKLMLLEIHFVCTHWSREKNEVKSTIASKWNFFYVNIFGPFLVVKTGIFLDKTKLIKLDKYFKVLSIKYCFCQK